MTKLFLIFTSISGSCAVVLGALGVHTLKDKLESAGNLATFNTAVQYQFYHTLALFLVGLMVSRFNSIFLTYAGYCFFVGIIFFSGSLYLICFSGQKWFGAIAPVGGASFVLGWVFLLIATLKIEF